MTTRQFFKTTTPLCTIYEDEIFDETVVKVTAASGDDPNHQEKVNVSSNEASENVHFKEEASTYSLDLTSAPDATFGETGAKDSEISGFLNRYIELQTFEWEIGSDFLEELDPWTLWRTNARIAQKLAHFRFLKMGLEVKFVINGTPFHYGQVMAAYAPMLKYWGTDFETAATASSHRDASSIYNFRHYAKADTLKLKEVTDSYFSTFPHVMIVPGPNNPVELVLPFIWHYNYLRVNYEASEYSDSTNGMESPGSVVLTDLVGLNRSSDTASTRVNITIWARAVNIDLNTPTVAVASSEVQKAAAPGGFVSGLATGVARFAAKAAVIPGIKPYAKATEVAATTIGSVAQLFGFSKPTDPSSAKSYSVNNAKNIAVTNTSDNSQKLSFDVNQEITVDSRVIGADGTDEMSFAAINQRWWWCGKAPWTPAPSSGAGNSYGFLPAAPHLLYRCLVSPTMWRRFQTDHTISKHAWHLNPSGYLANTFNFWRGSVTYRIQVVASKFHTGRLKIQFDPSNGDAATAHIETRYTWILDLTEANEIEVTIPYTSFRGYLGRQALAQHSLQDPEYSTTVTATTEANFDEDTHMGFFSISVVNDLVAPNGVAGIVHVSVWQKMQNDTELQVPASDWHDEVIRATGASETVEQSEDELVGASSQEIPMWPTSPCPDRTSVWFGERVLSIRSLVKRFTYSTTLINDVNANGAHLLTYTIPHWPSVSSSASALKNTYLSYFTPCFLAKRGGMRFKVYDWVTGDSGTAGPTSSVSTATNMDRMYSTTYVGYGSSNASLASNTSTIYDDGVAGGYAGGTLSGAGLGDRLVEVEAPYYQAVRFQVAQHIAESNSAIDLGNNYLRYTKAYFNANATHNCRLSIYAAAAEDMSLMFFLACPVLYEA
jgi:hypothetical protein